MPSVGVCCNVKMIMYIILAVSRANLPRVLVLYTCELKSPMTWNFTLSVFSKCLCYVLIQKRKW